MARNYFAEEILSQNVATLPSKKRDYFSEEIGVRQEGQKPLNITGVAKIIRQGFETGVLKDPIFQQKARVAQEMLSARFPLFQPVTNIAVKMQEGDFNPRSLAGSFKRGLPIPRLDRELGLTVQPMEVTSPRKLITNVAKAVNPNFKEPTNEFANIGLDILGGLLTGAPQGIAEGAAGGISRASGRVDLLNATKALKNAPERVGRLRTQQTQRVLLPTRPKALPFPEGSGEGFRMLPQEEALAVRENVKSKIIKGLGVQQRKTLPLPTRQGEGFTFQPVLPQAEREMIPALKQKGKTPGFLGEEGQARFGKSFEGMSEDEIRKEITRMNKGGLPQKERKFITTVGEAPKTKEQVKTGIEGEYTPITNVETLESAKKIVDTNLDEAIKIAKSDAPSTAESNAVSQVLIDRFQNEGRFQDAIDIVEKTAQKATTQGQAIQALSMYNRLTPEGVLRFTQRVLDKANRERPGLNLKLSEATAQDLVETAKRVKALPEGRPKVIATAQLLQKIHKQVPPNFLKKVSMVQTMFQLLNPKTAIRNLVGNTGFTAIENVSDVLGAGIDKFLVSPFTGQRSKVLPSLSAQARGFKTGAIQGIEEARAGVNIAPGQTQFDIPRTGVFQGGIGEKLERWLNYELRVPDRAFFQSAYEGSLNNQMRVAKVSVPTEAMKEVATMDGLYRTFQDPNTASKMFSGIKKALNVGQDFGLGDFVLKYPKTPGSLLARGIEYSPAGFIKTAFNLYKGIRKLPGYTQKGLIESISRPVVGTSIVGTGILLSRLGIITGRKEERKGIRELKQETGLRNYQVNVSALGRFIASGFDPSAAGYKKGDNLSTYDWFQPQAISLAIGANIDENKGKATGIVGTVADAIASGSQTLAEQPVLSGLKRAFGYGDLPKGISEVLKSIPSSFVPTFINQIRLLVDDVQKEPSKEFFKGMKENVQMRLPGLSKGVQPKLTPFGEPRQMRIGKGGERAFNVFLNPAITSRYGESHNTDIANELIQSDTTIPEQGGKFRTLPLRDKEIRNIDIKMGQIVKYVLQKITSIPNYQKLSPVEKNKIFESVIRKIKSREGLREVLQRLNGG